MKKIILFLGMILLAISGCSNSTTEDVKNKGLEINNMQSGVGAIDDADTFDKQKFSYDITISNKDEMEVKEKSIEIVLTDWIKQNQIENKITEITFDTEIIIIKGYVTFNTKGLNKKEIVNHQPFLDGVKVVTEDEEEIFLKSNSIKANYSS